MLMNLHLHNHFAYGLASLNPDWNDERLFQEARRIAIAVYQHITYSEWIPLFLGKKPSKTAWFIFSEIWLIEWVTNYCQVFLKIKRMEVYIGIYKTIQYRRSPDIFLSYTLTDLVCRYRSLIHSQMNFKDHKKPCN